MPPAAAPPQFRLVGDEGILIEFENKIDPQVNERVINLYRALVDSPLQGVKEVVPAYRTVLAIYDPMVTNPDKLARQILARQRKLTRPAGPPRREVLLPVCYGGDMGPDLEYVARINGLAIPEVISLHGSVTYRVYMLGFTPGFPYLGGLPEQIRAPRKTTPRTLVPMGSVGIANDQTGIYPVASPGGWQIIGRTPVTLFSVERQPPSLVAAGDVLRFYPVSQEEFAELESPKEGGWKSLPS